MSTATPRPPGRERPGYATSWAEMIAAVVAHLDAYGPDAVRDVDGALIGYTLTAQDVYCGDCPPEPTPAPAEPTPGLSPRMRTVLDLLADGRPRIATEIGDALDVRPQSIGGTLAALDRRGFVTRADALWWRR